MPNSFSGSDPVLPAPPHPGRVFRHDFMEPLDLTSYSVAKAIGSTPAAITKIARGRRAITPEMALRLARYTGTSATVWSSLQATYDLHVARRKSECRINATVIPLSVRK